MGRTRGILPRMYDPQRMLFSHFLEQLLPQFSEPSSAATARATALTALRGITEPEAELLTAIEDSDHAALSSLIADWKSGRRPFPTHDRELLKGAMTTFRKSLKVKRLDAESSLGGSPLSTGRKSSITGITPPSRFADDVWHELARQKRLIALRNGTYTLPDE